MRIQRNTQPNSAGLGIDLHTTEQLEYMHHHGLLNTLVEAGATVRVLAFTDFDDDDCQDLEDFTTGKSFADVIGWIEDQVKDGMLFFRVLCFNGDESESSYITLWWQQKQSAWYLNLIKPTSQSHPDAKWLLKLRAHISAETTDRDFEFYL
jgi:hypothetical protein